MGFGFGYSDDDSEWEGFAVKEETEEEKKIRLKKAEEERIKRQEEVDGSIEPFKIDQGKRRVNCRYCYDTGFIVVLGGPSKICRCKDKDYGGSR